jgi:superfamily II DNA/RNA helicase
VFNLELPSSAAHYAHRAGRTGRMGAPGLVITLVAPGERFVVERLSKKLGVPIMVRGCVWG